MAQYGRRMRMRRLYDDASPDGHGDTSVVSEGYTSSVSPYPAPPPSVANGPDLASMESVIRHTVESGYKAGDSQFESVANDLTKRVKSMEDKSMMIDTTTRRMLSEAERVRSKLLEVEADVQKSVAELTSGLERSFRGASDSRREAEAVKEWTVGYVNAQVNSSEQATRASLAAESEGVSQKVKRNQELIASLGEQLETSLSLTADRLKASVNDSKVAVQARLTDFEARIQSAAKRADTIEARLTDALEIGLVREKNSRERAVAEVEKMVHHAVQVSVAAAQREVLAEVKKTNEFAETATQRMDAIERLLKAEIRHRMELAGNYDKMLEDTRKGERTSLEAVARLEAHLNDRLAELSHAATSATESLRQALGAHVDGQKKAVSSALSDVTAEINDLRQAFSKRYESLEEAKADLAAKGKQLEAQVDEVDRTVAENRATSEREVKEARSLASRLENKLDESVGDVKARCNELIAGHAQAAAAEAVSRESSLRDLLVAECKKSADLVHSLSKTSEKSLADLRRFVGDHHAEATEHKAAWMEKVTRLVQKTDDLSRTLQERYQDAGKKIGDLSAKVQQCEMAGAAYGSSRAESVQGLAMELEELRKQSDVLKQTVHSAQRDLRQEVEAASGLVQGKTATLEKAVEGCQSKLGEFSKDVLSLKSRVCDSELKLSDAALAANESKATADAVKSAMQQHEAATRASCASMEALVSAKSDRKTQDTADRLSSFEKTTAARLETVDKRVHDCVGSSTDALAASQRALDEAKATTGACRDDLMALSGEVQAAKSLAKEARTLVSTADQESKRRCDAVHHAAASWEAALGGRISKIHDSWKAEADRLAASVKEAHNAVSDLRVAVDRSSADILHRVESATESGGATSSRSEARVQKLVLDVDEVQRNLEKLAQTVQQSVAYRSELEVVTAKLLDNDKKIDSVRDACTASMRDTTASLATERSKSVAVEIRAMKLEESTAALGDKLLAVQARIDETLTSGLALAGLRADLTSASRASSAQVLTVLQLTEAATRDALRFDESRSFGAIATDLDFKELTDRVEMDFEQVNKLTERIVNFYEKESSELDRRVSVLTT